MAESSLSLSYTNLTALIGRYLGYGESATGAQLTDIQRCIAGGLRMFYRARAWNFLDLTTTLTTGTNQTCTADASTDYITCASHGYVNTDPVTFTSTTSVPGGLVAGVKYYVSDKDTNTFKVAASSGGSAIDLTSAGSGTISVRKSSTVYDLPEGFGTIRGGFHHAAGLNYLNLRHAAQEQILEMRNQSDEVDRPRWFCIRAKSFTTASSTGQRFEVMFYPEPDQAYTLSYSYRANPETLDGSSHYFPLGGMEHTETILESCLAWGEKFFHDEFGGPHWNAYQASLADSIQRDSETAPESIGKNLDFSEDPTSFVGSYRNDPDRIEGLVYD